MRRFWKAFEQGIKTNPEFKDMDMEPGQLTFMFLGRLTGLFLRPTKVGILSLVSALLAWAAWNAFVPSLFQIRTITYWEAWGVLVLCEMIFNRPFKFRG